MGQGPHGQLISKIYEVDPLSCLNCGKKIKIITFVTHPEEILPILRGISWPIVIPEFDPPPEEHCDDICQLHPNTPDEFPELEIQVHYDTVPDPPIAYIDPPHSDDYSDPPHWQE